MTADIDKTLRKLRSAIGKLQPTEGRPIARRNARARVLAQLRKVRAQIDEAYPAIIKRGKVQRLTPKGREARLEREGWKRVPEGDVPAYAAAGVRVRRVEVVRPFAGAHDAYFVPEWAVAIGHDKPSELRAAKKSRSFRRARIVAATLSRGDDTTALATGRRYKDAGVRLSRLMRLARHVKPMAA